MQAKTLMVLLSAYFSRFTVPLYPGLLCRTVSVTSGKSQLMLRQLLDTDHDRSCLPRVFAIASIRFDHGFHTTLIYLRIDSRLINSVPVP
jgi:hypothetical protein